MAAIWAIARLTFWEGIRMRIVLVFLVALLFILLIFPTALNGDGTLAGRLQTFLSYSISSITYLLGLATIFLSCATLSREIQFFQIHMVLSKPVSRFQVLVGKWLGANILNLLILALAGLSIYGFARVIRNQPVEFERDRVNIDDVVWTARLSAEPQKPEAEWRAAAEEQARALVESGAVAADPVAISEAVDQRYREMELDWRTLKDGEYRDFRFENLKAPERAEEAIQIRFKARGMPLPLDELLLIAWQFVDVGSGAPLNQPFLTEERSAQRHQFLIKGQSVIKNNQAIVRAINPPTPNDATRVQFEHKAFLEILYKVGSFETNFLKALVLVFLQLAFLSALGLFFSTFVSFPIACLCTCTAYLIAIAYPFWMDSIGANLQYWDPEADPYGHLGPYVRTVMEPFLWAFPDFVRLSGATALVDGEYISFALLGEAAARTVLFSGALLLSVGWLVFKEREIAGVTV